MNVALWIVQIALGLLFLVVGGQHAGRPKELIARDPRMGWVSDFSQPTVRFIGIAEILGGLALIVGSLTAGTLLVGGAAVGLAVLMAGAVVVHARRREWGAAAFTAVLCLLAIVLAYGRFGPEPL